jgi:putative transcriptional regulator
MRHATRPSHGKRKAFQGDTPLGKQIIQGLRLAVRQAKGEVELPTRFVEVPDFVNVKAIREKSGLTQTEFARRYGISPRSLQEWEQGRRQPEGAVRAYLMVIDRNPQAVEGALWNR